MIFVHVDLLSDDPFFFLHIFIRKIRFLHEIKQRFNVVIDLLSSRKKVDSPFKARIGIHGSPL